MDWILDATEAKFLVYVEALGRTEQPRLRSRVSKNRTRMPEVSPGLSRPIAVL